MINCIIQLIDHVHVRYPQREKHHTDSFFKRITFHPKDVESSAAQATLKIAQLDHDVANAIPLLREGPRKNQGRGRLPTKRRKSF